VRPNESTEPKLQLAGGKAGAFGKKYSQNLILQGENALGFQQANFLRKNGGPTAKQFGSSAKAA